MYQKSKVGCCPQTERFKQRKLDNRKDKQSTEIKSFYTQLLGFVKETDNVKDWVEFDMKLADGKLQKKRMLYVVLSY